MSAAQVHQFNALRRPECDAFHLPNHYVFITKPVPLAGGEGVFICNPYNGHDHFEGRTRISTLSPAEQAKAIVPLLLEAFITRFDHQGSIYHFPDDNSPWAPFTWSTTSDVLARAMSTRLREIGVSPDLCLVEVEQEEELKTAEACWKRFEDSLLRFSGLFLDGNVQDQSGENVERSCLACGFTTSLDKKLLRCSRCRVTWYCSKECQRRDWKLHKPNCVASSE
ncbi:Zinc finger MYND-type [Penicillium argentinense]|uniref:Zinc finger MYND-type n=1 Tax=Penicillium argentinense TaxID=1131581 RepID=A0A9W9EYU8_9EURO|nr:Zinc finger MYND-type [Penicillium argentinense]KAJ5090533.1 Zinc finger MYND-type [Penicillium argentinense]